MALWLLAICWYICAGPHRKLCRFGTSVIHKVVLLYVYSLNICPYLIMLSATNQCVAHSISREKYTTDFIKNMYKKKKLCKFCLSLHLKYFITVMSYQDLHVCVRLCYTLDHSSGLKLYFFRRTDFKWLAGVPKRLVQREREREGELFRPLSSGSLEPGQ